MTRKTPSLRTRPPFQQPHVRGSLARDFVRVRSFTKELTLPLAVEDQVIQSMPDVSPTKWHLAHTTWFFEQFVLREFVPDYEVVDPAYHQLFNSYYETVGQPFSRRDRGLLSRPTVAQVFEYRRLVEERVQECMAAAAERDWPDLAFRVELGLQHEQQHQELLLTDIKHVFSRNPLRPAYGDPARATPTDRTPPTWVPFAGGREAIGHAGDAFCYDNERPRHELLLRDFELASRPVSCGEYLEFIEAGGYERPELWLADGWSRVQEEGWRAPLYWESGADGWRQFTLRGMEDVQPAVPVAHVSFYEADAFARFRGARLPTEAEWEVACRAEPVDGNFIESYALHPRAAAGTRGRALQQAYGDVWEWTQSPYSPYPGFQPLTGAIGEYNGKFMCSQMVLRGGSCATSRDHVRPTYRNFFYPDQRWQFSGFRLARDV